MKTVGLELEAKAGRIGVVHPEDRALQGCNPSAGWASEPAGPGGGDIARAGQPAGPSRKRKIPGGSGDRVPRGSTRTLRSNHTKHAGESPLAHPTMRRFTLNQNRRTTAVHDPWELRPPFPARFGSDTWFYRTVFQGSSSILEASSRRSAGGRKRLVACDPPPLHSEGDRYDYSHRP